MDDFLDQAWMYIQQGLETVAGCVDLLVAPLEAMGPAWVILVLAFLTIGLTRVFKRMLHTRRHDELETEFKHWQAVREAAMTVEDREKGKAMAKNIDQAQLNKAYYDYFFEGFMVHLASTVLPILLTLAYLSRTYTQARLEAKFGSPWIITVGSRDPFHIGTLFWYIICTLLAMTCFALISRIIKKKSSD